MSISGQKNCTNFVNLHSSKLCINKLLQALIPVHEFSSSVLKASSARHSLIYLGGI